MNHWIRDGEPPVARIHPEDADPGPAILEGPGGRLAVTVHPDPDLPRGTVVLPFGDPRTNPNLLVGTTDLEPFTGQPVSNGTPVRIDPAQRPERQQQAGDQHRRRDAEAEEDDRPDAEHAAEEGRGNEGPEQEPETAHERREEAGGGQPFDQDPLPGREPDHNRRAAGDAGRGEHGGADDEGRGDRDLERGARVHPHLPPDP